MQPECAGKRVREDDPKEGEVPADDDDAAASAAASASAQDDPDAEAGKILTASEGLEAVPIPSAEDAIYFDELMNGVLIVGNHASFSAAIGFDELMDGSNGSGLMPIGSTTGSGPMSIDAIMFLESLSLPELVLGTPMAVPVAPLPMMVTTESVGAAVFACWGAELMGTAVHCTLGFVSGKAHFKNKFCARCRQGINVPVRRIRALTADQQRQVTKRLQTGFWKRAPGSLGGGEVRIANNTSTCEGPWVAVFRHEPPPIVFELLPLKWQRDDVVKLVVAKDTLVPFAEIRRSWMPSLVKVPKRQRHASTDSIDSKSTESADGAFELTRGTKSDAEAGLSTTGASVLAQAVVLALPLELPDSSRGQVDEYAGNFVSSLDGEYEGSPVSSLGRGGVTRGGSPMSTRVVEPELSVLAASHAHVIATLEAAISRARTSGLPNGPEVIAALEQFLAAARQALQETHRLAAFMGESSRGASSAESSLMVGSQGPLERHFRWPVSIQRLTHRPRVSVSANNILEQSPKSVSEDSQSPKVLSRGSSDGKILSKDSRRKSLVEGMRRLFLGMSSSSKFQLRVGPRTWPCIEG